MAKITNSAAGWRVIELRWGSKLNALFVHVILPQALYNGFIGAACEFRQSR